MRRIKRGIIKHFNCVPWLILGVQILRDGNISRWQMRWLLFAAKMNAMIHMEGSVCIRRYSSNSRKE